MRRLMLFSESYLTITKISEGLVREKGSKFLSYAVPVTSESGIKEQLNALKKAHPSANHHCYAWRLGADKTAFRSNDDGEPSNSAGKPIFSQIQASNLTNILVVVVRYFGGTLLGVGGLVQAYKKAAQLAIGNATVVQHFILFEYRVIFKFEDMNRVMRILKEQDAKIISTSCEENNIIIFHIKKQNSELTEKKFSDLYTSKIEFLKMY